MTERTSSTSPPDDSRIAPRRTEEKDPASRDDGQPDKREDGKKGEDESKGDTLPGGKFPQR